MSRIDITAWVRGMVRGLMAEGDEGRVHVTSGGELIVAQGLPPEAELARQGLGCMVVGTAVTPVAAVPTTAAHLSLYNADPTKSLIITAVGALCSASMAVAGQAAILARNDVPSVNANPAGALSIFGTNGKQYSGRANAKASVTLAAIGAGNAVGWVPIGPSVSAVTTTTIGLNLHQDVWGRWIVQPNGIFSLSVIAQTAAGSFLPYIKFYEAVLPVPA